MGRARALPATPEPPSLLTGRPARLISPIAFLTAAASRTGTWTRTHTDPIVLRLAKIASVSLVLALSIYLSIPIIGELSAGRIDAVDWGVLTTAGERALAGKNPYGFGSAEHSFRWSPLMAYGFAAIAPIGVWGWSALAVASLALLRDWRLIGVFLAAYPFWMDLYSGASFGVVPVVVILALRGSSAWSLVFVGLAVLIPRPLMLPVLAWLLWQRPELRVPAMGIAAVLVGASLATGWGDEWITRLVTVSGSTGGAWSIDPPLWMSLALLPVAAWLTWRGRLGWASLVVSPYILPSYGLMLTVDAGKRRDRFPRGHA